MLGNTKKRTGIHSGFALLFATVYFFVLFLGPLHTLKHLQPQEDLCYEEDNLCHLRLVHHDIENGCDHEFHFTDDVADCDLCALLQHQSVNEVVSSEIDVQDFGVEIQKSDEGLRQNFSVVQLKFSRGPPNS